MQQEMMIKTQAYRTHLVAEMERRLDRQLQTHVRQAFLCVPRDLFVEAFYEQRGNTLSWDLITSPLLETVYRDEALTTKIDQRGMPASSSSQPSLMAQQLEALDLSCGQRVLEIGTGTGYNAALMGQMVGESGMVVSIDSDADLVSAARLHLEQAGCTNVLAIVGDGFLGEASQAPYDRILATCGIRTLPRPWLYQLQQNGVLMSNVLFNLASVFLRLEKISDTQFQGRLLPIEGRYMEMQGPDGLAVKRGINWKHYDDLPHTDVPLPENGSILLKNTAYSLLLQCLLPGLSKHHRLINNNEAFAIYVLDRTVGSAAVRISDASMTVYGDAEPLAKQISESMLLYKHLGYPDISDYQVSMVEQQTVLIIGDQHVPLKLLD
jgi:protein-L-isoaspartate(D-aspartate) O-methyltransferase